MIKKTLIALLALGCVAAGSLAVACASDPAESGHTYGDWQKDANRHWHACTDEGCNEKADEATHTYGSPVVKTPATCSAEGTQTLTCTVCGYSKDELITKIAHAWDNGTVTTEATCNGKGVKTYSCTACETGEKTEDIDPLGHNPEYKSDEHKHWQECTRCDYSTTQDIHNYIAASGGKFKCEACENEVEATAAATLAQPATLDLNANYSLVLNKSDDYEQENGYFVGYFTLTPAANMTLTFSSAKSMNAGYTVGYYEHVDGPHDGYNQFVAVKIKTTADGDNREYSAELEAGTAYSISVKKNKEFGGYVEFGTAAHTHEYDLDNWTTDATHHWHSATCHANATPKDKAAHIFGKDGSCECGRLTLVETAGLTYSYNDDTKTAKVIGSSWTAMNRPTSVTIPAVKEKDGVEYTVTEIYSTTLFQNDNMLESLTLPSTIKTISASKTFNGCEKLKTLHLVGDTDEEALKAFCNITYGTSSYPFYGSKDGAIYVNGKLLENLELTVDGNIPDSAFNYCTSLKSVKITVADGVTEPIAIGNAFQNCANLKTVEIGEGVATFGQSFMSCSGLTSIKLPASMTDFNGCRSCKALESVVIMGSGSVTFGTAAFGSVTANVKVYFNGTSAQWDGVKEAWTAKLKNASVYLYEAEESNVPADLPEGVAGYWHFDSDNAPAIWGAQQ